MEHPILVIDDDIISQNMLRSTLSGAGYSVIVAADGDEGIKKAFEHLPGLIILDIMMPGKDGGEVARLAYLIASAIADRDERLSWKEEPAS
ncbi:MAG: response regulator [Candidatus Aminicenantales bacterium]